MLLREIHLRNVGPYRGEQVLRPSTDPKRPVTLVGGRNGSGKTTLLDAVPLCLYGGRARQVLGVRSYARHLDGLIHEGEDQAAVTLVFDRREHGRDVTYIVDRWWRSSKNGQARDRLFVMVDGERRTDLEADWSQFVERIMPLSISGLAVFDGERIAALADVGSASEVLRASLYGLLGLDLVDQLKADLAGFRRRKARDASTSGSQPRAELEVAEAKLEQARRDHGAASVEVQHAQQALEDCRERLEEARDALSRSGGDLFARREELRERRVELREQKAAWQSRLQELVRGDLPLLMIAGLVRRVAEVGEERREYHESQFLVRHLKERDTRLIDRLESEGGLSASQAAAVAAVLDKDRSQYETAPTATFEVSDGARRSATGLIGLGFAELRDELEAVTKELQDIRLALSEVERALAKVPDEESVADLVSSMSGAEQQVLQAERILEEASARCEAATAVVEESELELNRLTTAIVEVETAAADEQRINREVAQAQVALETFGHRIVERNLTSIKTHVLDSFRQLIRKKRLVDDLLIDPETLDIELVGPRGNTVDPDRLSAGERQTLATALLWGLSRATERTLPTMIDTPVGRLDSSHRLNLVAHYFPNAARQVILLSTDEELVGDYYDALERHIGATFLLDYQDDDNATLVRDGYFS